jgi:hypothetical protein
LNHVHHPTRVTQKTETCVTRHAVTQKAKGVADHNVSHPHRLIYFLASSFSAFDSSIIFWAASCGTSS